MTSPLLPPGMSLIPNPDSTSAAAQQQNDTKKKRKNSMNRCALPKQRRLATSVSRRKRHSSDDTSLAEPQHLSNGAFVCGRGSDSKALKKDSKLRVQDGVLKSDGFRECKDFEERITSSTQATHLGITGLPNPLLQDSNTLESVQEVASDRMQDMSEGMVLRPRRPSMKEIKENLPPSADSQEIVGRRIEVYWPLDAAWYCGLISSYDATRKKHRVCYDDGEEEWLCLSNERFKLKGSKTVSVQSGGIVQTSRDENNGCAFEDDLLMSALPSTYPVPGSCKKASRKGAFMSTPSPRKRAAIDSAKNISSKAGPRSGKAISAAKEVSDTKLRDKVGAWKVHRHAKFVVGKPKGRSMDEKEYPIHVKGGTDVDGDEKAETGNVYVRRQINRLKVRSSEEVKKGASCEGALQPRGQHLQERSYGRRKQKRDRQTSSQHTAFLSSQGAEDMGGMVEGDSLVGAAGKRKLKHSNSRKQDRKVLKDGGNIIPESQEGSTSMPQSINADAVMSAQCAKGQSTWRARRKHKIKSLAHTTFAAKAVSDEVRAASDEARSSDEVRGPCGHAHKQSDGKDLATADPASLPKQADAARKETGLASAHACKSAAKDLRMWAGQKCLERNSLGGRKSSSRYKRCLRRKQTMKKRMDPVSSNKLPSELITTDRIMRVSCNQVFNHQNNPLPTGHTFETSLAPPKFQDAQEQEDLITLNHLLTSNNTLCLHSHVETFHFTIHFPRLQMVSSLFTWQLFNILRAVGLCGGYSFEEMFCWMGSTKDLANIVLLLMLIIKCLPDTFQGCWQGRVLHGLWSVLRSRERWVGNLPDILSFQVGDLLMQHLRQLVGGYCLSHMTSRQMFNVFVSYIIKPYVYAVLCERGAQLKVVVQQFLLHNCPHTGGLLFERQCMKWVSLRSCAGAEADFSSHLSFFPISRHWHAGNQIFQERIEEWIACADHHGCVKQPIPAPSFKLYSNQEWQLTSALVFCKKFNPESGNFLFCLHQDERKHLMDSLRLTKEARDLPLNETLACFDYFKKSVDLYTGISFASILQKRLHLACGKQVKLRNDNVTDSFPIAEDKEGSPCSKLQQNCLQQEEDKGEKGLKMNPGQGVLHKSSVTDIIADADLAPRRLDFNAVKEEVMLHSCKRDYAYGVPLDQSRNDGPFTTDTMKEEVFLESSVRPFDIGAGSNRLTGSSLLYSMNGPAYNTSGSSSNSSFESNTRWKSTNTVDPGFRLLEDMGDQHGMLYGHGDCSYLSGGQRSRKRIASKSRPRPVEHESMDFEQFNPCCIANALITERDRSWREVEVKVELQSKGSEWFITLQREGGICSHKVLESTVASRVNRYTHAMMWKGGDCWTLEFGNRDQWACFKRMYEECSHRNARAAFMKQIPIPNVKKIEESMASDFTWLGSPCGMIRQRQGEVEVALNCASAVYDMDSEDESWLLEMNERASCIEESISVDTFERIVDKLERITYLRQGEMVASDEVAEMCQNAASENAVLVVHEYWFKKRLAKDNALIRYFESPLWKKYQKHYQSWQTRFNEFQLMLPSASDEQLLEQCPRPPMFAFCLPSRRLDTSNSSKRMQRQRSQRHLNPAFKYARISSFDTSGESRSISLLRSQKAHDTSLHGDRYQVSSELSYGKMNYWPRKKLQDIFLEQLVSPWAASLNGYTSAEKAQAKAVAARELAGIRAAKAQMQFLRFESALQRAVAALIEFENIYIAELALVNLNCSSAMAACERLPMLRKKIDLVLNQFLSRNRAFGALSDDAEDEMDDEEDGDEDDDDDSLWTANMHVDAFGESDNFPREEGTFLSISERAHLESWMRTTLRQRAC